MPVSNQRLEDGEATQAVQSLRLMDASRFEPLEMHHIETLHRRACAHNGRVRLILDLKVLQLANVLAIRIAQKQEQVVNLASKAPAQAAAKTLRDVIYQLAHAQPEEVQSTTAKDLCLQGELKVASEHRNTWTKLRADTQLSIALEQAPKSTGPINSQTVALRSLALMRDISPDYLSRFITHIETLVHLECFTKESKYTTLGNR